MNPWHNIATLSGYIPPPSGDKGRKRHALPCLDSYLASVCTRFLPNLTGKFSDRFSKLIFVMPFLLSSILGVPIPPPLSALSVFILDFLALGCGQPQPIPMFISAQ